MTKIILLLLLVISTSTMAQKLDGAFIVTGGQHGDKQLSKDDVEKQKVIKIFKNGFWICAYFGNPQQPFNGTCGGTYKTEKGKYIETIDYYSWDSTAVGDTYSFNYKLDKNTYIQDGKMDSEKYPDYVIREEYTRLKAKEPLKNSSMEGVWILQDAFWKDENGKENPVKNFEQIKIYSFPRFAYAQYNSQTKQFIGAGGGTYQYDGKKLVEHIEYTTYGDFLGSDYEVNILKQSDGSIQQVSQQEKFREVWKQAKQ
jgi:hypothetical protein